MTHENRSGGSTLPLGGEDRRRGFAAGLILVAAVPLLIFGGSLLALLVNNQEESDAAMHRESAALTAAAGMHQIIARLQSNRDFRGEMQLPLNGGEARIRVASWADDEVDNDGDGETDDEAEADLLEVSSVGWMNAEFDEAGNLIERPVMSFRREVLVIGRLEELDLEFQQSIYIDDPNAEIDLNGGAFRLNGADENLDGSGGDEDDKPAIGVNGDPSGVWEQIADNQRSHIEGDPPIGEVDTLDYTALRDEIVPYATMSWTQEHASYSGEIGDLDNLQGVVAYASGDLHLHGGTSGAGVLVVDGDLVIGGRFQFAGAIIVRGTVTFQGGGGEKDLHGALLLWGEQDSDAPLPLLRISGTVNVDYSSQALDAASQLAGVSILLWTER